MDKKKNKGSTFTFKQNIGLIFRGLRHVGTFPKPILLPKALASIMNAVVPFVNIYFSAIIINELIGARSQERLTILVILAIGINLSAMLIKNLLSRWSIYCSAYNFHSVYNTFSDKGLSMDFVDVENPDIRQDFSQVQHAHWSAGFGLSRMISEYDNVIRGVMQIIISAVIVFEMFMMRIPHASALGWLDSPWVIIAFITLIGCQIFIAPYLTFLGGKVWATAADLNGWGTRVYSFYGQKMIEDDKKIKDIHVYDQKRLIDKGLAEYTFLESWLPHFRTETMYAMASSAVTFLSTSLVYLLIVLRAYAGAFEVGSIVLFIGATTQFSGGFSAVMSSVGKMWNNNPYIDKLFKFVKCCQGSN